MNAYSLRRRLLAWLILATAGLGIVALADTWREAVRTAQGLSDRILAGSALAIAERVTVDEAGGLEVDIPFSALEMLASTAEDQVFYRVDAPPGRFLTGYDTLAPVAADTSGVGFADARFGDVPIRSATLLRRISTGEEAIAFTVTVAETTLARDALARTILIRSALRLIVLILSTIGIVWLAVTVALRPLDRLGAAIAQRTPGDLNPLVAGVPRETEPLVDAINSFMGRLAVALNALRNFTSNASHQLRTPLATLRTQLALARRAPTGDQARDAFDRADAALIRAERVLAQLLALARVDAAAAVLTLGPLDLSDLVRRLTAEFLPAATGKGIDLGFEGDDGAVVNAEPVLCAELLRNLLDNALRYAGHGAIVTARVRRTETAVLLEVEDNGVGLRPDRLRAIRERHPTRSGLHQAKGAVSGVTVSGVTASGVTVSGVTASGVTASGVAVSGAEVPGLPVSGGPVSGGPVSGASGAGASATAVQGSGKVLAAGPAWPDPAPAVRLSPGPMVALASASGLPAAVGDFAASEDPVPTDPGSASPGSASPGSASPGATGSEAGSAGADAPWSARPGIAVSGAELPVTAARSVRAAAHLIALQPDTPASSVHASAAALPVGPSRVVASPETSLSTMSAPPDLSRTASSPVSAFPAATSRTTSSSATSSPAAPGATDGASTATLPAGSAPASESATGMGYGVGLAIVLEIGDLFGATCSFNPASDGRGLIVSCRFDAAPPPA